MNSVLSGIGQAGGKLAEASVDFDTEQGYGSILDAVVINTAQTDFKSLSLETILIAKIVSKATALVVTIS